MNKFDQILNQIQNETADSAAQAQAAGRVRQTLFGPGAAGASQLKSCDDFQSLIPAYLQRTLSDARRMLLEDHIRECIPCRRALDQARNPKVRPMPVPVSRPAFSKWSIAAAALVVIGA